MSVLRLAVSRCAPRIPLLLSAQRLIGFDVASEEDFEKRVLQVKGPVLVDFHARYTAGSKVYVQCLTS